MTKDFQTALSKIKNQQGHLEKSGEREVRNLVINPLLLSVGWDVFDHKEVWNEMPLQEDGIVDYGLKPTGQEMGFRVDYSLLINGESRVFIEVKQWSQNQKLTDANRNQLLIYCAAAGKDEPKLAVLTNGRYWRFYIAPVPSDPRLRQFLPELDIVSDELNMVEEHFRQFLGRDRTETMNKTLRAAHQLHHAVIEGNKVRSKLTKAWNRLTDSQREQEKLLSLFAQSHEIDAEQEHIKDFLVSSDTLFNCAQFNNKQGPQILRKPRAFTFRAKGEEAGEKITFKKSWNRYVHGLAELMYRRHSDLFADNVLAIQKNRFIDYSDDPGKERNGSRIEDSNIYFQPFGHAEGLKNFGHDLLKIFGYSEDALTIYYN